MRVGLVYKRLATSGGSEIQLLMLARHLVAQGIDTHLFCAEAQTEVVGATLHRMPVVPPGHAAGMLAFSSWARRATARVGGFDVTHAFGRTLGQSVYRLGGGCHRTYLERSHALESPPWLRALARRSPYQILKARLEERAVRAPTTRAILVNSDLVRHDLLFRYALPPGRLHVVRNGVDLGRFRPAAPGERDALRAELGLPLAAPIVLFLGTGYARKGLQPTLQALARLRERAPDLRLVVAGRDGNPRRWRVEAARLGLADAVFLGPRADPERLYRAADVSVLPTSYDPSANTTLEALASGTPVVTSDMNGASELFDGSGAGCVVPAPVHPDDVASALATLLRAGPRLGAAARALAERHPIERSCATVLEVYRGLAAADGRTT